MLIKGKELINEPGQILSVRSIKTMTKAPGDSLIGQSGYLFSRQIADKYGFSRIPHRLSALIFLRAFKGIGENKIVNQRQLNMVNNYFIWKLHFYLKLSASQKSRVQNQPDSLPSDGRSFAFDLIQLQQRIMNQFHIKTMNLVHASQYPAKVPNQFTGFLGLLSESGLIGETLAPTGIIATGKSQSRYFTDTVRNKRFGLQAPVHIKFRNYSYQRLSLTGLPVKNYPNDIFQNLDVVKKEFPGIYPGQNRNSYDVSDSANMFMKAGNKFHQPGKTLFMTLINMKKTAGTVNLFSNSRPILAFRDELYFKTDHNLNNQIQNQSIQIINQQTQIQNQNQVTHIRNQKTKILNQETQNQNQTRNNSVKNVSINQRLSKLENMAFQKHQFMPGNRQPDYFPDGRKRTHSLILSSSQVLHVKNDSSPLTISDNIEISGNNRRVFREREGKPVIFWPNRTGQDEDFTLKKGKSFAWQKDFPLNLTKAALPGRSPISAPKRYSPGIPDILGPNLGRTETIIGRDSNAGAGKTGSNLLNQEEVIQGGGNQADFSSLISRKHIPAKGSVFFPDERNQSNTLRLNRMNSSNHLESLILSVRDGRSVKHLKTMNPSRNYPGIALAAKPNQSANTADSAGPIREVNNHLNNIRRFLHENNYPQLVMADPARIQTLNPVVSSGGLVLKKPTVANSSSGSERHESIIPNTTVGDSNHFKADPKNTIKKLSSHETRLIADQVFKILERRISIEKDRRGLL